MIALKIAKYRFRSDCKPPGMKSALCVPELLDATRSLIINYPLIGTVIDLFRDTVSYSCATLVDADKVN